MVERRQARRWVIPPAISRGGFETIDRIGILEEHEDAEGVLLWRLVRDVELWAGATPAERLRLFAPRARGNRTLRLRGSTLPTDVRAHLRRLGRLLSAPLGASEEDMATHCAAVAQWAREIEARETALAFAQAAALASNNGVHALLTGRCAEEAGQRERARTWYVRAVGLARRRRDAKTYAAAFVKLGQLAERDRNPTRAQRHYLLAFRAARRGRHAPERARAAIGLFRLARASGDPATADRYAIVATRGLLRSDRGAAALALALAEYWIEHRKSSMAVRLLDHLERIDGLPPAARATSAVLRVRAGIAAGDVGSARRAWAAAYELLRTPDDQQDSDGTAAALLALAKCAAALNDRRGIERAGRAALVHASAEEFPRIQAELVRLAGERLDFGPPLAGAA